MWGGTVREEEDGFGKGLLKATSPELAANQRPAQGAFFHLVA
jgi:hypothetical protein